MRKVIAAINTTLDGVFGHTAGIPDDEKSLILQLMKLDLIDQYQLCVHPIVAGSGLPLFEDIDRTVFKLNIKKTFGNGAVMLYYEPTKKTAIKG